LLILTYFFLSRGERLQLEDDLALLRDLTSALRTLLDKRPDAADQVDSIVPRVIELLSVGDGDYQYGDVETYEYKDQTHYDTNHFHRSAPRLIATLAPTYADQLTDGVPDLLHMLRQPGQRNTSLRRASHKALTAIAMHLTGSVDPMFESEFDQLDELLNHTDSEVQIAAIELLVLFGIEDARRKLNEVQKSQNEKLSSIATKGIHTLEIAIPLDTEVSELIPSGDNAIEQQQNRFEIQRAYEFLQSKNSARKQMFIEEIYPEERNENADKWWQTIRAGLQSIETVELSGNTHSYSKEGRIKT
jgi:hypothetical protein